MTKYVFLFLLAFVLILAIVCAFLISRLKREKIQREQLIKEKELAEKTIEWQQKKEQILNEVFDNAKKETESLHTGNTADRFAAADAILRNN